jgi:hypothetical protein
MRTGNTNGSDYAKWLVQFAFILALALIETVCYAQPSNPNGGAKPGTVPISGIEILIAAGTLLGVGRFFKSSKKRG